MKVIIVGCEEIGQSIAKHLVMEDHSVVMVDEDAQALESFSEVLDIQTVNGLGSRPAVLAEAGADSADMLIAVTLVDEVNMVACQMGYSLFQIPKKIARVGGISYLDLTGSHLYSPDNLPVDVIISPEKEVAEAIRKNMFVPGAFDADTFADGELVLVGCKVASSAPLLKKKLVEWRTIQVPFQPLAILRKDRIIIPNEQDRMEAGDDLYFLTKVKDVADSMSLVGKHERPLKDIFVIGGGRVGFNLADILEKDDMHVRILEKDKIRADFLAEHLNSTVVQGNALNASILKQENIGQMDVVLAVSSDDAANIIASVTAKELGAKEVITLIRRKDFLPLAVRVGLERTISPHAITVSRILQQIRRGGVAEIHSIRDGLCEVLEFEIQVTSSLIGSHVEDITVPDGTCIGAVVYEGLVFFPNSEEAVVKEGCRIIVFASGEAVKTVESLFGSSI